jgi:hypothetical protein
MAEKSQLEMGQRVKFLRSHDRTVELTGRIVKIHDDSDAVDIETEPDGRIAEVSTTETAHAADVTVVTEVSTVDSATEETATEETGAESRPRRRRFQGD